jgi:hypothetical protein
LCLPNIFKYLKQGPLLTIAANQSIRTGWLFFLTGTGNRRLSDLLLYQIPITKGDLISEILIAEFWPGFS